MRLLDGEYSAPGASQRQQDQVCYLLTALNRLRPPKALPEWEPLVLAALMQHHVGALSTPALLMLLEDVERLAWLWALPTADRVSKAARQKRVLQVRLTLAG